MIKQFVNDIKLIGDLFNSFLIQKGVLKRRPLRSWYYKNREGIKFKLRKGAWDSAVIMETWWLKEYVKNLDDFEDGAIIIDSGAHLGSFSIFMASKLDKVKIYAFEPDPDNFNLLKENIKINHLEEKIFPFKFALSEKEGKKIKLNIHPDNLGMHSTVFSYENLREEKKEYAIEVETITLEKIFQEHRIEKCSLLKMDCEGCEYPVLSSVSEDVLKKIRNLTLEYHRGGEIQKIKQRFEQTGFKTKFDKAISNRWLSWLVNAPLLVAWRER